jgi:endoplasmic reticulum-Golgi intermediate compartment protein 3
VCDLFDLKLAWLTFQVGSKKVEEPPSPGNGTAYCGSCYGAEQEDHPCCNTCDEVRS